MRKRVPKAVYVRCYSDRWAFELARLRLGDSYAHAQGVIAYYAGGSTINMREATCRLATAFVGGLATQETAGAFTTLTLLASSSTSTVTTTPAS